MFDPAWARAISSIESSGRYNLLGPVTASGDRAYGKYQVMGNNVGPWTQQHLGRAMTPQEFLSDPDAQDQVFQKQFGATADKYGSPQEAASVWFTGRPMAQGANASDILGTTGSAYVDKFNRALGQPSAVRAIDAAMGNRPDPQPSGAAMADGTTPPPNDGFLGQLARFGGNASNGNYTLADALGNAGVSMMALDNAKGASALSTNMALTRKTQVPVKPAEYQYDAKSNTFFRTNPVTGALETTKNPNADEADKVNPDTIKAIIEGRAPYPANSRAADAVATREAVAAADPTFDAVNYNARLAARKDFTSGKSAQNLTSFNTAIGHLGTLDAAIDPLNNGAYPAYNTVANAMAGQTNPDFAASKAKFDIAKTAVTDELTRAFRLSGGNVHDIEQWEQAINSASSPEALHAAVKQAAHLLDSRVQSVGDQYNRGMGTTKDPLELLNPKAAASFKTLLGASGGDVPATPAATLAPATTDRSAVEAEMRRRGLLK